MAGHEVALRNGNGEGGLRTVPGTPARGSAGELASFTLDDVWDLAVQVASSGLFPNCDSPASAFTLMMLCQADGLHPIQALRRYHIIEKRPSMRSDAMQAEFQKRGGRIKILRCDAHEARAIFSHPEYQPDGFEMAVTFEEFDQSGLARDSHSGIKKNWRQSRPDMLWARLVSKAIRRIDPGVVVGIYSTEEVSDMIAAAEDALPALDRPAMPPVETRPGQDDPPVAGYTGHGFDDRPYHQVVTDAVKALNDDLKGQGRASQVNAHAVHKHLLHAAINLGHADGPPPDTLKAAIQALTQLYRAERAWLREELMRHLEVLRAKALEDPPAVAPATEPDATPAPTAARYLIDGAEHDLDGLLSLAQGAGYQGEADGELTVEGALYVLKEQGFKVQTKP